MTNRTLLLVDDEPNILKALRRLLHKDGYTLLLANSGEEALDLLTQHSVGVIVSDHRMPVMTGIEFLAKVKGLYPDTTRIVLSGFSDIDTVTEAINQGNIYKFIAKPWDDTQLRTTIQEAFENFELRAENNRLTEELKTLNASLEKKNVETTGLLEQIVNHNTDGIIVVDSENKVIFSNPRALTLLIHHYKVLPGDELLLPFKENQVIHHSLPIANKTNLSIEIRTASIVHEGNNAFLITIHDLTDIERFHEEKHLSEINTKKILLHMVKAISTTIEKRDPYTAGHQNRASCLALAIGKAMELDDNILEGLSIGALVYDIGKIYIPTEILNRPGKLNKHEHMIMQEHPTIGHEMMLSVDFPWPIGDMILQHHEHIDGSGYPNQISGNEMSLEAKIIAVVDTVTAMAEYRPYRNAHSKAQIIQYITEQRGKKFDATIVDACLKVIDTCDFEALCSPANSQKN